mmetsp:Transcript_64826/g.167349  ORF Transcript_64826/g.167349 Transcript_64826/m.167349 type:complete len:239 (-) Transcript_64826:96-812(-)
MRRINSGRIHRISQRQKPEKGKAACTETEDNPLSELLAVQERGCADGREREKKEGHDRTQEHRDQGLGSMLPDHCNLCAVAPLSDEDTDEGLPEDAPVDDADGGFQFFPRARISRVEADFGHIDLSTLLFTRRDDVAVGVGVVPILRVHQSEAEEQTGRQETEDDFGQDLREGQTESRGQEAVQKKGSERSEKDREGAMPQRQDEAHEPSLIEKFGNANQRNGPAHDIQVGARGNSEK